MIAAAAYRTDVHYLANLRNKLRLGRPAPTIRAAAPAPAVTPTAPGGNQVSKHIYESEAYRPEPGEHTTALGRYTAEHLVVTPEADRSLTQHTQVINLHGIEQAMGRVADEEPLIYQWLIQKFGFPAYDPPVEPADLVEARRDTTGDLVRLPIRRPAHLGDV